MSLVNSWSHGNHWVINLILIDNNLIASLSNGEIVGYSLENNKQLFKIKAHSSNINKLIKFDNTHPGRFATCGNDGLKVWDLNSILQNDFKPIFKFEEPKKIPILTITQKNDYLVCGTELKSNDAVIHILKLSENKIYKSILNSQHDDLTDLQFHPTNENLLMTGSTDGYLSIYDISQEEEDDMLYQVIDYCSIHSVGWLSEKRIYSLSHMETFAIHELNDLTTEEKIEPNSNDLGDIRESWDLEYVVDYLENNCIVGGSINNKNQLKLIKFQNEKCYLENCLIINNPHNDEIVRCLVKTGDLVISGGEDGNINVWKFENPIDELLKIETSNLSNDVEMKEEKKDRKDIEKKKKKKHSGKIKTKKKKVHFKPY